VSKAEAIAATTQKNGKAAVALASLLFLWPQITNSVFLNK
jgi:hypothetical protein